MGNRPLPELHPVAGFRLGTTAADIRKAGRPDLVVMALAPGSGCAAVFTRNAFCAAPVTVAREYLEKGAPALLLVNTGNANAGTGAAGIEDARQCCAALAEHAGCDAAAVLPFSTGVIGEPLPVGKIIAGLPAAYANLSEQGWAAAAGGILTTDTVAKGASRQIELDGQRVTVTGMAKGAGMIRPDMATMLAFIATDAAMAPEAVQHCLSTAVGKSFNRISVDGDTSTNDACVLVATGMAPAARVAQGSAAYTALCAAVTEVCVELAQCLQVAYTIAHSPLVKTALFAADPNWGRILAAVGRAGVDDLDINAVEIYLDDVCIVRDGGRAPEYTEADGQRVMDRAEYEVRVVLGRGAAREQVWTCDLSYDYVKINAEYRT
jgi:glutamate N-acetyltransferase/amino-acid N-acetyltransferase